MSERPAVSLALPARAEEVGLVRQVLVGMADALAIDPDVLADMKMAVTEACTNVVRHAYVEREEPGPLDVGLFADENAVTVCVADVGSGIRPLPVRVDGTRASTHGLGLGLPLIAALTDSYELRGSAGGGTEVRMSFDYSRRGDPADADPIADSGWTPPGDAAPRPG